MQLKTVTQAGAVLALMSAIAGGVLAVESRYAAKDSVAQLISSNAQQIALVRIQIAKQAKHTALLRALCSDFKRIHGWKPQACA